MNKVGILFILIIAALLIPLVILIAISACFVSFLVFFAKIFREPQKRIFNIMMATISLLPIGLFCWWHYSNYLPAIDEDKAGDYKYVGRDKDQNRIMLRVFQGVYEIKTSKSSTQSTSGVRCLGDSKARFTLNKINKIDNFEIYMECCSYNGRNCQYEIAYDNTKKWLEEILYTIKFDKETNLSMASHIFKIQGRQEYSLADSIEQDMKQSASPTP